MRRLALALLVLIPLFSHCTVDEPHPADVADAGADVSDVADTADASDAAPLDADGSDAGVADADAGGPPIPTLRPIPAATATELLAYVRQLRAVADGGPPTPNAWAMVNWCCEDRAMALEVAIAAAETPLDDRPPDMVDTEMTVERITALAAAPAYDAASLVLAGPLVAYQQLVLPDGTAPPGPPEEHLWGYHAAVVINVDGELRVADLSVGDTPVPIDTWLANFVQPPVACEHMDEPAYREVWAYWNAALAGWELPPAPPVLCGYQITPLFTLRWDQTIEERAAVIAQVPATLVTQFGAFNSLLDMSHGIVLPPEQIPLVTSTYEARSIASFCEAHPDMPVCALVRVPTPHRN